MRVAVEKRKRMRRRGSLAMNPRGRANGAHALAGAAVCRANARRGIAKLCPMPAW